MSSVGKLKSNIAYNKLHGQLTMGL